MTGGQFFDGGGRHRRPSRVWAWVHTVLWTLYRLALRAAESLICAWLTARYGRPTVRPLLCAWLKRVRGGVVVIPESERRARSGRAA